MTEKHGAFSAMSFRRNKVMEEVGYGIVDKDTWGIFTSEF